MRKVPLLSVTTPALQPRRLFLLDAYRSLCEQECPWEWVVQLDGRAAGLPKELKEDKRVHLESNGRHLGIAITRNRALARTRGAYIQNLDADDMLLPGSLLARLRPLEQDADLAFCFGRSLRLGHNGDTAKDRPPPLAIGRVSPGQLEHRWRTDGRSPVKYGTILWRRSILLGRGGWTALSEMEDVAATLAISLEWSSYYVNADVALFRNHPDQVTNREAYLNDRAINRRFIHEYLLCARRIAGLPIPRSYKQPPPDQSYTVEIEKRTSMRGPQ